MLFKHTKISIPLRRLTKLSKRAIAAASNPYSNAVSHKLNIVLSSLFVLILIFAFYRTGLLQESSSATAPGEIILSGDWEISLTDTPENALRNGGKSWCPIGAPDPNSFSQKKPSGCFKEAYPVDKMRNATYWYRKKFSIPPGTKFNEPSLFLGAIKHKAWVYWDEKLISINNLSLGTGMTAILLSDSLVTPGEHTVAIRVTSLNTRYPGIFHAYPRGITLGDSSGDIGQHRRVVREKYIFPSINIFVQTSGLLLTLLLIVLGRGATQEVFWLSIYFFGSTVGNLSHLAATELHQTLLRIGVISTSLATLGYGLKFHGFTNRIVTAFSRIIFFILLASMLSYGFLFFRGTELGAFGSRISLAAAIMPILFFISSLIWKVFGKTAFGTSTRLPLRKIISLCILLSLHSLTMVNELILSSSPHILDHPAIRSLLSLALVGAMIYQFIEQERAMAFFGRFIRPGLKSLLGEQQRSGRFEDTKLFRARQIAIMKVDIVGHTEATYQMPYGVKRLFQDTWFTLIDEVVSDRVFLDKNVGDGSIYCFSETHPDGSCGSALIAAENVRDEASIFDNEFRARLELLLATTEELRVPTEKFFSAYKARTGCDFWSRKTHVRIALVYGFVDEGLWGLTSQSHYDVQGDLVSLAARIESKAHDDEILLSEDFVKQLPGLHEAKKLLPRQVSLKGMGEVTVFSYQAAFSADHAA